MEYTSIKEMINKLEMDIPARKKVVDAYIENKWLTMVIGDTNKGDGSQHFNLRIKMRMPI